MRLSTIPLSFCSLCLSVGRSARHWPEGISSVGSSNCDTKWERRSLVQLLRDGETDRQRRRLVLEVARECLSWGNQQSEELHLNLSTYSYKHLLCENYGVRVTAISHLSALGFNCGNSDSHPPTGQGEGSFEGSLNLDYFLWMNNHTHTHLYEEMAFINETSYDHIPRLGN